LFKHVSGGINTSGMRAIFSPGGVGGYFYLSGALWSDIISDRVGLVLGVRVSDRDRVMGQN